MFLVWENEKEEQIGNGVSPKTKTASLGGGRDRHPVALSNTSLWPRRISKPAGIKKHVNTKHSWFFYFDEKPDLSTLQVPVNNLPLTTTDDCKSSQAAKIFPAFSVSGKQIGKEFTQWLTGSGGGCKKEGEAQQIVRRS